MIEVKTQTTEVEVINNVEVTSTSQVVFSQLEANGLLAERGDRADYYYSKPMYKLVIDCDTVNNGKFVAKVAKVYVE